jgi:predicted GNAT superfamily acetyltransferase
MTRDHYAGTTPEAGPMNDEIVIRRAETSADYVALQSAQRRAWGITTDGYLVPVATMVGAQLHGGLVLGAFRPDGEAVGLSFAFLGRFEGRLCLYSQLTGVVPGYQSLGIGHRLKQAQWEYASEQGLALLAWAFDPLQAGNAYFNLAKLGATAQRYIVDMYGRRTDALNAGAATDRLIVEWAIEPRQPPTLSPDAAARLPRLIDAAAAHPRLDPTPLAGVAPRLFLEIPADIGRLRQDHPDLAAAWQAAVRAAFLAAFAAGYRATGFHRQESASGRHCLYLLEQA